MYDPGKGVYNCLPARFASFVHESALHKKIPRVTKFNSLQHRPSPVARTLQLDRSERPRSCAPTRKVPVPGCGTGTAARVLRTGSRALEPVTRVCSEARTLTLESRRAENTHLLPGRRGAAA